MISNEDCEKKEDGSYLKIDCVTELPFAFKDK